MTQDEKVYEVLRELQISFKKYEHPAVYTTEEAERLDVEIGGVHCKNLFLCNKKRDHYYLVILEASKKLQLKQLAEQIGNSSLSFASADKLMTYLGLTPGSVSVFGLINDTQKVVEVVIDTSLFEAEAISFHPNVNTATLVIGIKDFSRFLEWSSHTIYKVKI